MWCYKLQNQQLKIIVITSCITVCGDAKPTQQNQVS